MPTTQPHIDPAVLTRNLAALTTRQPRVAARLQAAYPPAHAEPALTRDGRTSFRLTSTTGARRWLGHSSMPGISGAALIGNFQAGHGNVLVPSIGHGVEVGLLLDRLAAHCAVFAWDRTPDIPVLALMLEDVAEAIRRGRLILAIDPDPEVALEEALADYPTHLPPATILGAPHLEPAETIVLQRAAETVANRRHQRLLDIIRTHRRDRTIGQAIAIVCRTVDPMAVELTRGLGAAAADTDMPCVLHVVDHPGNVPLAALAAQLQGPAPGRAILIDDDRANLAGLLDGTTCVTWITSARCAGTLRGPAVAMTPDLAACHAPDTRVLGPAVCGTTFLPAGTEPTHDVTILLDTGPVDAAAAELKWSSHVTMWTEVCRRIATRPGRLSAAEAERLVDAVCRSQRIELDAIDVRRRLVDLLWTRVAPTHVCRQLARRLMARDVGVRVFGSGWPADGEIPWGGPIPEATGRNLLYNSTRLIVSLGASAAEPVRQLEALASGAGVYVHGPADLPDPHLNAALPHFDCPLRGADRIAAILRDSADPCARSREIVRREHLLSHRLSQLLQFCGEVERYL